MKKQKMARINFDGSIFEEQGFQDLLIVVKDRQKAKGIILELFALAQKFWFPEKKLIPKEAFEAAGLPACLYAVGGLAVLKEDGIYVRGSKESFAWLFQKSEAGKKPKKPRTKKAKPPPKTETGDNGCLTEGNGSERNETEANGSKAPISLLSSPISSLPSQGSMLPADYSAEDSALHGEEPELSEGKKTQLLISRYCDLWKTANGNGEKSPPIVGKDAGIFTRLQKTLSLAQLETYLEAYFQMPDGWVVKAKHPLELFESKLKEIAAFADSGKFVTRKQASQMDSGMTTKSQLQRIKEGKL